MLTVVQAVPRSLPWLINFLLLPLPETGRFVPVHLLSGAPLQMHRTSGVLLLLRNVLPLLRQELLPLLLPIRMVVPPVPAKPLRLIRFRLQPFQATVLSVQEDPHNGVRLQGLQIISGAQVLPRSVLLHLQQVLIPLH